MGVAQLHHQLVLDHHVRCGGGWHRCLLFEAVIVARHGSLCALCYHGHDTILFERQCNAR